MLDRARLRPLPILLLGLVLVAAVSWPALRGPFLFDDFGNLDPLAKYHPTESLDQLRLYLAENKNTLGRMVSMLSFVPQAHDWPGNPWPFKLVNLLLHLFNATLVWLLAKTLLRSRSFDSPAQAPLVAWAPVVAALMWAVSPIQLSTTMLVIQRMTELMAMFMLIGVWLNSEALVRRDARGSSRIAMAWSGTFIAGALAVLSKENGTLLPLFVLVAFTTLLRDDLAALDRRTRVAIVMPNLLLAAAVVAALVAYVPKALHDYAIRDFSMSERLLTQPRVLFAYSDAFFLPWMGKYGILHDDFPVSHGLLDPWTTLPCLIAVLSAAVFAWLSKTRYPVLAFALLWFLAGHLIESSFIPVEMYFEHRNYVPLIGPCIALAVWIARVARQGIRFVPLVALIWFCASVLTTFFYARIWSDGNVLATAWHREHPHSARAAAFLAEKYIAVGKGAEALKLLRASRSEHPGNSAIAAQTAWLACEVGDFRQDDANRLLDAARSGKFSHELVQTLKYFNAQAKNQKCPQALTVHAVEVLDETLLQNPAFTAMPSSMGLIYYQLGMLAFLDGRTDDAMNYFELVEKVDPDPDLFLLRANIYSEEHRYDEALATIDRGEKVRWPLLRRLLVDDRKRFAEMKTEIRQRAAQFNGDNTGHTAVNSPETGGG